MLSVAAHYEILKRNNITLNHFGFELDKKQLTIVEEFKKCGAKDFC
jgi:hypothetical protein